ncbi:hypothetical protein ACN9TE_07720 [Lactococcus lactis]|jgi:hypothetical protein|uniref:hypothetical protein n=1 Tax=Lactococcus lactis TaxID=1358 RepID=UPI001BAAECED|nr:hypothetical protein [Lactococcus lactis]MBR8678335.1 hypothetical protein [Lactococcus lactis subsp. lactis]MBR8681236.1 hypothetical protein [Lactococcus lactis subsp. lactis]MBR8686360.1 hypothetical protein [Lactococcus lactis subsp. lactis]MDT3324477.1 hypothetical protein [Bacillota bacterium]
MKLDVPSTIETNEYGVFSISGKTEPETDVNIIYGANDDTMTSDESGDFKYDGHVLSKEDNSYSVYVSVDTGTDNEVRKEVIVKRSDESIKKMADDKAKHEQLAREAQARVQAEEADKKNPATYPELPYDEMARNGNKHKGEKLKITGTVRQVMDTDTGGAMLRVATSENGYDDMYLVQIDSTEWENHRLLKDDVISFYGEVCGLYSYESTMGGKITVPDLIVNMY